MRYKDMTPEQKKEYHRASAKKWREKHKSLAIKAAAEWRSENRERFADMKTAWRLANPEKVKEQKRRYREKHAEKILLKNRDYQQANPDKCSVWRKRCYRKNPEPYIEQARKRKGWIKDQGAKLSRGLVARLLISQNYTCVLCPADLRVTKYHRDHIIPLSKGGRHEDANIQILCATCNLRKGAN